jgi:hypothetical protein
MWAALGNTLRAFAFGGFFATALLGYRAYELYRSTGTSSYMWSLVAGAVFTLVIATLLWNLKGSLVAGGTLSRSMGAAFTLLAVIGSLGTALIVIGVVYFLTEEPQTYDSDGRPVPRKVHYATPRGWKATATVGASGAMAYQDEHRDGQTSLLDSFTPVQVTGRKNGLVRVVAITGQTGWIDARTVTEARAA